MRRLLSGAALLFLLLALPALAETVLVVVPGRGQDTDHKHVERVVAALKEARQRERVSAQELPILRLSPAMERHGLVLERLSVEPREGVQVLLCRRDRAGGWPEQVVRRLGEGESLLSFVREAAHAPERLPDPEKPSPSTQIGLLLVYRKDEQPVAVKQFLTELGRHWMERYGRTSPPPYPLASYDLSDPVVVSRLRAVAPQLVSEEDPAVALCFFSQGRPVGVLEVHRDLDLPATLVRRLSAARGRHLAETVDWDPPLLGEELPSATGLTLSDGQETSVAIARVHELANQLWAGTADRRSEKDRPALQALVSLIELSRTQQLGEELRETLADFRSEPLDLSTDSDLEPIQRQLLQLIDALLR